MNRDLKFDIDENGNAVFVADNVPAFGYKTYEITTAAGRAASTLKESSANELKSDRFRVRMRTDGNIASIRDLKADRELVNDKGELPFNALLRVEGNDASRVVYPFAPRIWMKRGAPKCRRSP